MWTAPFGRPVVPDVWMIMNGSSADVSSHAASGAAPRRMTSAHVTSRSRFGYSCPRRSATITVRTVGAPSAAASAVSFIGTTAPRRWKASAQMRTDASLSRSRPAMASAP